MKADKTSQWMSIGQAAQYLGVSRDTLRRWEKVGKIKAFRSPTNRRYYTKKQLDELINQPSAPRKPGKKEARKPRLLKLIIFAVIGFILAVIIVSALLILPNFLSPYS